MANIRLLKIIFYHGQNYVGGGGVYCGVLLGKV